MEQLLLKNIELYKKYASEFQRIFGRRLKPYFDNLMGFDLIKFDDEVVKSGDGCMKDVILETWGQPGVDIVTGLIGK